ncbi:MAG TPA: hypothetical protein VFN82_06400 [Solirubrobacterales bacterium]|nr:hypothetical protein [Solirubrobacterales bacterium]
MAAGSEHAKRGEAGQAAVELVAVLPFLALALLMAGQLMLAGQALWSAGVAARAGARSALVERDPAAAARAALPAAMRAGAKVEDEDGVAVRVPVPRLLPDLPPLSVAARAALEDGDG